MRRAAGKTEGSSKGGRTASPRVSVRAPAGTEEVEWVGGTVKAKLTQKQQQEHQEGSDDTKGGLPGASTHF